MVSPARKHFQKTMAAVAAGASAPSEPQNGDQYALMSAALVEDRRRLHDIQSIERKIELKAELLPAYQPYIEGVLEGGNGAQDDVFMLLMLWHLDVGDLVRGLTMAEYALKHNMPPPDTHQRTTATLVAEEVADHVLRLDLEQAENLTHLLELAVHTDTLTKEHDMHDQVRAKLYKAIGYLLRALEQLPEALAALKRALALNEQVGVKKDIERLERAINKQTATGG